MAYRFHHVHLLCSDLEQSIAFFTGVLGARLVTRKKFGTADGASLDLSGTTINLRVAAENEAVNPDTAVTRYGYHHICVEVDDLDAAYGELVDQAVDFITPPKLMPDNNRVAFFKGPDDIVFELLQA
jgi:catechol 2,3-dioxygenase-like lactoylglutathione lyase family enzyme